MRRARSPSHGVGANVGALLLAAAVTNVAYTLLIPLVPVLERGFGMSAFAIGVAFGGFALTKAVFQPIGGMLSDRHGARRVATLGLLATAGATFGLSFAGTGGEVVGWRLAWGVAEGLTVPALYQLCFAVRPDDADLGGKVMGWYGSAAVLGMAAGPAFVGLLYEQVAFGGFFQMTAGLTVLAAAVVALTARPPAPRIAPAAAKGRREGAVAQAATASLVATVLVLGAADFLNNFLFGALEPTLPLYVTGQLGGGTEAISTTFTLGLLTFVVFSAPAGFILERVGVGALIGAAFAVASAGFAVQGAAGSVGVLTAGFLLFMTTQPLVYVAARRGIAEVAAGRQGKAFGLLGLVSDFGYVLGPLAGTALLSVSAELLFAALGAACVVAALVAATATRARRAPRLAALPSAPSALDSTRNGVGG